MVDKNRPDKETAQLDVEQIYQQASTEMPSKQTDEAILQFAQSQVKVKSKPVIKSGFNWRVWQWPASIAASVLFVAVLFSHYDMYRNPVLIQEQLPQSQIRSYDDYRETVDTSVYKPQPQNLAVQQKQRQKVVPDEPAARAMESKLVVERRARIEEELPEGLQSAKHSLTANEEIALPQSLQEEVNYDLANTSFVETAEVAIVDKGEYEQIVVTGARVEYVDGEVLDTEFLDALLRVIQNESKSKRKAKQEQESVASNAEALSQSDNEVSDVKIKHTKAEAEKAIRQYLKAWQEENPDGKIPEKYQKYLDPKPEQ